jgi:kinesin family protein C2/C3
LRSEWDSEKRVEIQNVRDELKALVDKSLAEKEEFYQLYIKENKARKSIHNKLIELQGNIRVICRVRPVLDVEKKVGQDQLVTEFPTDEDVIITKDNTCKMKFEFDRVFTPSSSQEEVFMAVQPLCVSVLEGYNVCIFACNLTRTHT